MPLYNSPLRLEKLSLLRMGRYMSDLSVHLLTSEEYSCTSDLTSTSLTPKRSHQLRKHLKATLHNMAAYRFTSMNTRMLAHTQKVCELLRNILYKMIPYYMVNVVTSEFLKQLDERLDVISELVEQPQCKRKLQEIVKAIIHPELTEILVTWKWKHITDFVITELGKLHNLKVFKLPVNVEFIEKLRTQSMGFSIAKQLPSLVNLQKFVFHHYCTDYTLRVLSESCPLLKCLDIYLSNGVSDISIKYILKFRYMEELDITATEITDNGRVEILNDICVNNAKLLKSYRTYCVTNAEINALTRFSELKELTSSFIAEDISVREFRKFRTLEVCNIYSYGEFIYTDLFKYIGNNLRKLSFVGPSVNIIEIIKHCPLLSSLTVKVDHLRMFPEHLSEMSSLQHLTLRTRDSSGAALLLSVCLNLTSLQLCAQQMFFFTFLEDVMQKNQLRYLQSLCVGSLNGNLPPEVVTCMTRHCDSLYTCKVFGGQDSELRALYEQYPGIEVNVDLWIQLADNVAFANKGRKTEIVKTIVNYMYEFRSPNSFE